MRKVWYHHIWIQTYFDFIVHILMYIPESRVVINSVSEYKKWYIRNSTQILENLRNAVGGFFGLRNQFWNVQRNKKRSTQNVFKLRNRKKQMMLNCSLWTNKKGLTELITVQWSRAIKPKSTNMYQKVQ